MVQSIRFLGYPMESESILCSIGQAHSKLLRTCWLSCTTCYIFHWIHFKIQCCPWGCYDENVCVLLERWCIRLVLCPTLGEICQWWNRLSIVVSESLDDCSPREIYLTWVWSTKFASIGMLSMLNILKDHNLHMFWLRFVIDWERILIIWCLHMTITPWRIYWLKINEKYDACRFLLGFFIEIRMNQPPSNKWQ